MYRAKFGLFVGILTAVFGLGTTGWASQPSFAQTSRVRTGYSATDWFSKREQYHSPHDREMRVGDPVEPL